jgi:outer membrane receptor protein involved in Fe transport
MATMAHAQSTDPSVSNDPSAAQGGGALGDIVVTAAKRSEKLQSVPMSITAIGGAQIQREGIQDIKDYSNHVPNLTFSATDQSRTSAQSSIEIRGISGSGTTGFYIDDSPLIANLDPRVIELDRIEVLRGPQGTLYGARSMGGTVRFITKQPDLDQFSGQVHVQASGTSGAGSPNGQTDAVVNIPVIPGTFAIRALAYVEHDAGWLDRAPLPNSPIQYPVHKDFNDSDYVGGQITGLLSLDDGNLTITPRFMYQKETEGGRSEADYFAGNTTNARLFDINEPGGDNWKLGTLTINYKLPFGNITSASSYFKQHDYDQEDGSEFLNSALGVNPPVPGYLHAYDNNNVLSQEVRFVSDFSGPFEITTGVFYQRTHTHFVFPPQSMEPVTDLLFELNRPSTVKEFAQFAEANLKIIGGLKVTAGVRHFSNTVDSLSFQGGLLGDGVTFVGHQKQSGFTPKFGLEYKIDDDHLLFANAAKGYRVGGVNSFAEDLCTSGLAAIGISADKARSFNSDSLWSYEAGAKTSWFNHHLTVNATAFLIDWKNLQQTLGLGTCGYSAVVNVGAARSKGGELEANLLVAKGVNVSFGGGYTDAYITNNGGLNGTAAAAVGSPVQNAPKWTISSALDIDRNLGDLPAFFHVDYAYVGSSYNARNTPRIRPSYSLVNLRTGVDIKNWEIAFFVKNLTNKAADFGDVPPLVVQLPGRPRIAINQPRTIGLEGRIKF